jgi:hypothetical protein
MLKVNATLLIAKNKFVFEASDYQFMIGTSSRDSRLETKLKIK